MNKFTVILATAVVSFTAVSAHAGGWGSKGNNNNSSGGLINVAPAVALGDIKLLNGLSILNKSPILSGNNTVLGNGILSGIGLGILGVGAGSANSPVGISGGGNSYTDNSGNNYNSGNGNSSYSVKKRR
jgi:hypothetical protein